MSFGEAIESAKTDIKINSNANTELIIYRIEMEYNPFYLAMPIYRFS
ncbi:hypothetical protein MKX47_09035 [Solibacillus sp. FSL R7-0668]